MPGEDEQAALERRTIGGVTERDNKPPDLETLKELIKLELAADHESARRKGLKMDDSTVNVDRLAAEIMQRDKRRVEWSRPQPPGGWFFDKANRDDATIWFYRNPAMSLLVGISCEREDDGRAYIHLSVSHRNRIPTWGELGKAKEAFLGDLEAYQVFPPRARYVNIHPHCLNLYAPLESPVLPDFTRKTGGI